MDHYIQVYLVLTYHKFDASNKISNHQMWNTSIPCSQNFQVGLVKYRSVLPIGIEAYYWKNLYQENKVVMANMCSVTNEK